MTRAICNSSPIIGLSIIKKLNLLFLLLAKDYKKIDSVKKYLDILIENGFRMSIKLYNEVLKSAQELD